MRLVYSGVNYTNAYETNNLSEDKSNYHKAEANTSGKLHLQKRKRIWTIVYVYFFICAFVCEWMREWERISHCIVRAVRVDEQMYSFF